MSKIVILGDTHFGARGDSLDFHRYFKKFYDDILFPFLRENHICIVFQLGDLFDRRKFMNFNSLYLCRKYFFDKLWEENIQLHTLIGNHDIFYRNTLEVNSSELLLNDYNNVNVFTKFETIDLEGLVVDVVPWLCDDNQEEILSAMKNSKADVCFGHFEIDGFEMDRGNVHQGGLDRKELKKYDIVLSGHFHHRSSADNITYVGTPYEMTWSDYKDPKGFHVLDTQTRELVFHENPYKMFQKIVYDDEHTDFDYWKNYNYAELHETFVKVVVAKKENPYLFDTMIDNLYRAGVADLSIVEEFSDSSIENDAEIVNQAEDTMTILSKYIDNLSLNVESEKLKSVMREVYIEALDTEKTE